MMVYLLPVLLVIALADPDCTKIKSTVVKRGQNITINSTHHNADKSEYYVLVSFVDGTNVTEKTIARATCRDDFTCTPGSNNVSGKSEICCDFNHVTLNKMNASIHDTGIFKIYRFGVSIRKNETCVYSNATVTGKVNELTSTSPSPGSKEPHSGPVNAVWGPIIGWIFFGLIIFGLIIGLTIYFCYKKGFSKKQDMPGNMEMGEMRVNEETGALVDSEATGEIGQKEEMRANGATGALGVSEATREIGQKEEMRANEATGALGVSEETGEIGEREEMGESGEVGDMRAREETEKLLPHTQNNTVYQTKDSLTNPLHCE